MKFTEREAEVIKRTAKGSTSKDVASELGISNYTVLAHLRSIGQKLSAMRPPITKGEVKPKPAILVTHYALLHGLVQNLFN